jgi:hypothetical protein
MLADFTIDIHDARKPMSVQVKVHDNVAALRSAAARYTNQANSTRRGSKNAADFSDTFGVCHRFHMANDSVVALVRLAPPHISAEILSHEMAHAAVWLWQIQNQFKGVVLEDSDDEWFCSVLGELVGHANTKLIEKKIY